METDKRSDKPLENMDKCGVCGDEASCHRLYGATVCSSCKVFFWRTVKSNTKFTCGGSYIQKCKFDKFSRNKCKKCRHDKCLIMGMRPELVNSKETTKQRKSGDYQKSPVDKNYCTEILAKSIPTSLTQDTQVWTLLSNDELKIYLDKTYEESNECIFEDLPKTFLKELIEMDESIVKQIQAKRKVVLPYSYVKMYVKNVLLKVVPTFLKMILRNTPNESISYLASDITMSYIGLVSGLENCFRHGTLYEQAINSYPSPKSLLKMRYKLVSQMKVTPAIPLESYEMQTSPWTESVEDEQFVAETHKQVEDLIKDDTTVSRLFTYLVLCSSTDKQSPNEGEELIQIQKKISSILYNHMIKIPGYNEETARTRLSEFVNLVDRLHFCGPIYQSKLLINLTIDSSDDVQDLSKIYVTDI